ncbi:TonB-dependent receptor plug domain-containing protein, partial [Algoriphagus sp. NF]|uniref:TonB-dependent receptor plug domain-containing protein n=1 Tax=Algoriphagus sp. NF TaxID=2992756 RepID=UPI00237B7324
IGYGTTRIKDATGAITAVGKEDFNKGVIQTPEGRLNGRVPGLTVTTGGEPGAGSTIRIRGGSSLSASNSPLIVINGLPIDNNQVGGSRSILSALNPNDIESFTVLKDASATAIYGSRASNGVIIIQTKEARDQFRVNLDLQTNVSELAGQFDVFSADEYRSLIQERRPELVSMLGEANTNWQEEIYRTGVSYNANLTAEGFLFNKIPVRVGIGRIDQEGIRLTSNFVRTSANLNIRPEFL